MNIQELLRKKNNKSIAWNTIYTSEEIDYIVEYLYQEYLKGLSLVKMAKLYKIGRKEITLKFKKRGYKIVNRQNKLRVREDLFKSIETEEDAYWLGFIYADGYILNNGYLGIDLSYVDYEHLLKFADYCQFDKDKVVKKQKTNFPNSFKSRIGFATQHLRQRFFDLGIIPKKSLILKFPDYLKSNLVKHFIRGYVDGDGCITYSLKKKSLKIRYSLSIISTYEFLTDLRKVIPITNKAKLLKDSRWKGNTFSFSIGGHEDLKIILPWLYENSTIYLERKYNKYLHFKNTIINE